MADQAAQIDAYLKRKGSPLAGHGKTFVAAGKKYGVDPRLIVGISGIESSFGKRIFGAHNAWGWGPGRPFGSWEEAISTVTRGIKTGYYARGLRTPQQIVTRYAPGSDGNDEGNWAKTVSGFMNELGGPVVSTSAGTSSGGLKNVPKSLGLPANFDPHANVKASAMQNLQQIAMGRKIKPTSMLAGFSESMGLDKIATESMTEAMAQTVGQTQEEAGNVPLSSDPLGASDDKWGGSQSVAAQLAAIAKATGLSVVSEKRDRRNTSSGGVSDHWTGSRNAYAFDLSNGSNPTPEMDRAAAAILARLGSKWNGKGPIVFTTTQGGYRVQVLYRTNVGGNHFNHIHVGVRKL